ncbi:MAG TPA: cupin domain-containing protein, partial [Candidatus Binatia bacterium]|nr:cupin domain-containing protein [Candidatus Binatia bacterium]
MAKAVKEFEVHPYVQFMMDKYSPYKRWIESEGVPIVGGAFVQDVRTEKLGYWKRKDCKGAICTFSDQMVADAYIAEIDPGKQTKPQRQLYEEIITIAAGRGATTVWYDGTAKRTFEWERGSTFAIPLNAWHQHFNATGTEPCRYLALTSQPVAFELYRDPEFIYNTNYMFKDRFDPGDEEFFSKEGKYFTEYYGGILHSNFIPDIRKINLVPREKRGKGTRNMYIHMSGSAMLAHVSQFPVGRYKKAHRHGPGAHVFLLDSTGYTL